MGAFFDLLTEQVLGAWPLIVGFVGFVVAFAGFVVKLLQLQKLRYENEVLKLEKEARDEKRGKAEIEIPTFEQTLKYGGAERAVKHDRSLSGDLKRVSPWAVLFLLAFALFAHGFLKTARKHREEARQLGSEVENLRESERRHLAEIARLRSELEAMRRNPFRPRQPQRDPGPEVDNDTLRRQMQLVVGILERAQDTDPSPIFERALTRLHSLLAESDIQRALNGGTGTLPDGMALQRELLVVLDRAEEAGIDQTSQNDIRALVTMLRM